MSAINITESEEPMDRLTTLCAEMTSVLNRPENSDVKAVLFLDDEERGGIQLHGYEDHNEAMAHVFIHMQAVFRANGADLDFVGIPESPEGL